MLDDCQPPDGVQIDILILSSGNIEDDEDIIDCSEQQKAEVETAAKHTARAREFRRITKLHSIIITSTL